MLHAYLSSGADTVGQTVADLPSGLSLTPPQDTKKLVSGLRFEQSTSCRASYVTLSLHTTPVISVVYRHNHLHKRILNNSDYGAPFVYY
jgi:hypothetical protein